MCYEHRLVSSHGASMAYLTRATVMRHQDHQAGDWLSEVGLGLNSVLERFFTPSFTLAIAASWSWT